MRLQPGSPTRACAGFTLIEVLVALFVVALGIGGAAALQTLAVRSARAAAHMADGTRLARSLAERMRANPRALARPDADNPYLLLDYDAGSGAPAASALCYADATCDPDALARFDVFEVAEAVAANFPGGRIRVCRDTGSPAWACDAEAGASLVVKLGWREGDDRVADAPRLVLPLAGAQP
jgi:type IV pilus assembly protein PilV